MLRDRLGEFFGQEEGERSMSLEDFTQLWFDFFTKMKDPRYAKKHKEFPRVKWIEKHSRGRRFTGFTVGLKEGSTFDISIKQEGYRVY